MNRTNEVISLLDDSDDDAAAFYAPPPIKVASRVLADETIEILDTDDEGDDDRIRKPAAKSSPKKRAAMPKENRSPNTPRRKLKKSKPNHSKQGDDDDEIGALDANLFASSAASLKIPAAASILRSSNNSNDDDNGIELVGSIGDNALTDFPHARENCVLFPFAAGAVQQHCRQCFCFVCDCVVAQCRDWNRHCHATYQDPRWKQERQRMQQQLQQQQASSASQSLARTGSSSHNNIGTTTTAARWNHPFPRQPAVVHRHNRGAASSSGGVSVVQTLLDAVTRVYPREQAPPPPFVTTLRHYQKQSLSFMVDVETSRDPSLCWEKNGMQTRGGWLCSEVGMGKSAVVIALVAANPFNPNQPKMLGRKLVKSTVILTSVSLMGQWEDECKKHAPHLKVVRFHSSARPRPTIDQVMRADIVISSATFKWADRMDLGKLSFHRVVQDESHLFYSQSASAKEHIASAIPSARRWCVTATPMTSTTSELNPQSRFLGMPFSTRTNLHKPEFLKQFMIRHIKAQQIGGSQALALPKSTTTVQLVRMNSNEKQRYDAVCNDKRQFISALKQSKEAKWFHLANSLVYPLSNPLVRANSSKMKALESALVDLRRRDPNMRAVVFSQMREVLAYVRAVISRLGIQLYHFDGGSSAKKRDEAIRSFQSIAKRGPAVFCITLSTGSVGITLTAASHVFLMEPCINPAQEIQSAGRIHRLGQTKPVHVTKFIYLDSFENNTVKLHEQVATGTVQFTANGIGNDALNILLRNV